jgi:hypothetical protein
MTTRTFKQMGIAFGNQPAEITAKIGNVVVYQGPVVTLNEPIPTLPDSNYTVTNELFSWTSNVAFSGPQVIEITVSNGTANLLVAQLAANYTRLPGPIANTWVSSGPDNYVNTRWQQFGNTYIDGQLQDPQEIDHDVLSGMWWWILAPDSTFVENVTITAGG